MKTKMNRDLIEQIIDQLLESDDGDYCYAYWMLPSGKIVGVETAEHAVYLELNPEKFGLKFKDVRKYDLYDQIYAKAEKQGALRLTIYGGGNEGGIEGTPEVIKKRLPELLVFFRANRCKRITIDYRISPTTFKHKTLPLGNLLDEGVIDQLLEYIDYFSVWLLPNGRFADIPRGGDHLTYFRTHSTEFGIPKSKIVKGKIVGTEKLAFDTGAVRFGYSLERHDAVIQGNESAIERNSALLFKYLKAAGVKSVYLEYYDTGGWEQIELDELVKESTKIDPLLAELPEGLFYGGSVEFEGTTYHTFNDLKTGSSFTIEGDYTYEQLVAERDKLRVGFVNDSSLVSVTQQEGITEMKLPWIMWAGGIETRDDGYTIYHNPGWAMLYKGKIFLGKFRSAEEAKRFVDGQ